MSILVDQQDETINAIEDQAGTVVKDTEAGYVVSCRVCKQTETLAIQFGIYRESGYISTSCSQEALDLLLHYSRRPHHCWHRGRH